MEFTIYNRWTSGVVLRGAGLNHERAPGRCRVRELALLDAQIAVMQRYVARLETLLARARLLTARLDAIGDAA